MAVGKWGAYDYINFGPKFKISSSDPVLGSDGYPVFSFRGVTDDGDVHLTTYTETGSYRILNDGLIEIVGGASGDNPVDVKITGEYGDVWISAYGNGRVRIKGTNVMVEAVQDLDLKAGRNITLETGSGSIIMKGNKISNSGLTGNSVLDSFGKRAFALSPVGWEYVDDIFSGGINVIDTLSNAIGIG